jgi:hypothetical protein
MSRFKNATIELPPVSSQNTRDWGSIKVGMLMDLRDEAQEQNRLMKAAIRLLDRMDRRMAKHMPLTHRSRK